MHFHDFVGPLGRPSELVNEDFEEVKKEEDPLRCRRRRYSSGISAGKMAA